MMGEIPTVQSMEAVDLHLRMIVRHLEDIQAAQRDMLRRLATKEELEELRLTLTTQINGNSPSAFWRKLTEIAVGVVAICTAVGFMVAVFRVLKL